MLSTGRFCLLLYDILAPLARYGMLAPPWTAPQPEEEFLGRAKSGFVGLDNQGATCYLNALLQVCWHVLVRGDRYNNCPGV